MNNLTEDELKQAKVGIFWFYKQTIIAKIHEIDLSIADELGLIDSPFQHIQEWEKNHIYLSSFPELLGSEYQEYPRGRVVFNAAKRKFRVILDKNLFTKQYIQQINNAFNLIQYDVEYFSDPHYKVFNA